MADILRFPAPTDRATRVLAEMNAAELATDGPIDEWTRAVIHAGSSNRAALSEAKAQTRFWSGQVKFYERAIIGWAERGHERPCLSIDLAQARKSLSAWTRQVEVLEGLVKTEETAAMVNLSAAE